MDTAKEYGFEIKSSTGTMVITAIIFIVLAVALYYLKSCASFVPNVSLLIYALLGSALYIALVYSLFTPSVWWYKLIIIVFLILLLAFDWISVNRCDYIKEMASRLGIAW